MTQPAALAALTGTVGIWSSAHEFDDPTRAPLADMTTISRALGYSA